MKFTLPDGIFSTVRLSKSHQGALIDEAETVVSETLAANEAFLAQGAIFHDSKWRLVREKEGLHVYRRRPTTKLRTPTREGYSISKSIDALSATRASSKSSNARTGMYSRKHSKTNYEDVMPLSPPSIAAKDSIQEKMRRPNIPLMVLHGTVDGTLDDSMFGAFAATDQTWMWRCSHVNDRLDDARILATIRGPTENDPFRFLGIKWFAKEHPVVLTGILQRRDFLVMEATGITADSKGEKVGYFLMHSINLRAVPELSAMNIIRAKLSFCFLFRQRSPGKVELYCRGFSDPCGEMMERVSVAIAAETLLCSAGVVDYAYTKKLTWLVTHKGGRFLHDPQCRHCESCDKSFTKLAPILTVGNGSPCQICRRVVCSKCSVMKKMTVDVSTTGAAKQCALRFCLCCLLEVKKRSVWEITLDGVNASPEPPSAGAPRPRCATMPYKANPRHDHRSYSEYNRAGTRCCEQGEAATNYNHARKPDQLRSDNQQKRPVLN